MLQARRKFSMLVILALIVSLLGACGGSNSGNKPSASNDSNGPTAEAGGKETDNKSGSDEVIVLKYATTPETAVAQSTKDLMALVEKKLGNVRLEPLIIPGEGTDWNKKVTISLMAGDEMDIIYQNATTFQKFATANLIEPLDDWIAEDNYDVKSIYGSSMSTFNGKTYMLPAFRDVHITMYNKDLFDRAGIPYPDNNTWTWDKYVEAAKAISQLGDGIYGSYMLDWDPYFMFSARQKKVPEYKEDGTSNYDDPAFAESMKFFYDLGNEWKVQPDFITFRSKKMPWDSFLAEGKYGMFVVGNWALQSAMNDTQYPRNWKMGVAIMPQVNEGEKISLGIMGGYSVAATSKNKKAAFEAAKVLAESQWELPGNVPARIDLKQEDVNAILNPMAEKLSKDDITVENLRDAILDPEMDIVNEKIVGKGMTAITTMITSEGELYASKQRSLEETMKVLKEKSDQAIKDDNSSS
ncbi:ABC transporter substrate-binding protein [Paenibacillus sp. GXUN7292]|uniref:ABC transporter substrate-binding protein n=1 Tax=Paenibacillus sp. GXUN7292 TaxID=3422499 RepID=UPI003D7E0F22